MSYISLKKKATVVFLCLVSFTMGCILTSQFTTGRLLHTPAGPAQLHIGGHSLNKRIGGRYLKHESRNVSVHLQEEGHASVDEVQELAFDRNETEPFNEYDYEMGVKALAGETHLTVKPVSKFHYFVEVADPRNDLILKKVITKLPKDVLKSPVFKNTFLADGLLPRSKKGHALSVQKKWALLIDGMRELGYEQRLPVIINIGVKKSGTNAFGFFITQHPQIAHSIGNEVHYFDWNYNKGIEYYRSRMAFSRADQFSFEKTPRYFITPDAPQSILKDLPGDLKFVICVRDPVERAKSEFRHEAELKMRRGRPDRTAVRFAAKSETSASQGKKFEQTVLDTGGQVNASNEIVSTSIYSKHFKNWLEYFPRERFYILSDERVNKDIYTEMKNIEKFLGLEPFFERSMFYYNKEIHAPCMYVKPRPCPAKSTPGFLPKADPSPEVVQKLREFYRPYNQEFEKLTQMEFSWADL